MNLLNGGCVTSQMSLDGRNCTRSDSAEDCSSIFGRKPSRIHAFDCPQAYSLQSSPLSSISNLTIFKFSYLSLECFALYLKSLEKSTLYPHFQPPDLSTLNTTGFHYFASSRPEYPLTQIRLQSVSFSTSVLTSILTRWLSIPFSQVREFVPFIPLFN